MAQKRIGKPQRFEGEADETGLKLNETRIGWEEVRRVVSFNEGFVLDYNGLLLFIPASAFSSLEEKNRFAALLKEHIEAYIDMKLK